jgi:hypothetical protein
MAESSEGPGGSDDKDKINTELQLKYDYRKHIGPNLHLRALQTDWNASIAVTFHCIVPKHMWEWDDTSVMYIRFEGDALGNWKHNLGKFQQGRYIMFIVVPNA